MDNNKKWLRNAAIATVLSETSAVLLLQYKFSNASHDKLGC
jgi:hypothetical protein